MSYHPAELVAATLGASWQERPAVPARVVVAFSGGVDSTALLLALDAFAAGRERGGAAATVLPDRKQGNAGCDGSRSDRFFAGSAAEDRPQLVAAVHVHHGLQPAADAWAAQGAALASTLGIPFALCRVQVDETLARTHGLEAAARAARWQALLAAARQHRAVLALAHHRDDQVETVWLRWLRGAGVSGLVGMRAWQPRAGVWCWRPFLTLPKAALTALVQAQGVKWVEDGSNAATKLPDGRRLDRNWLRHELLPLVRTRFPGCDTVVLRTAEAMHEAQACLQELAAIDAATIAHPAGGWQREGFLRLSQSRQRNLVRVTLADAGQLPPPRARLEEALRQLAGRGRAPWHFALTPTATWWSKRDRLWWEFRRENAPPPDADAPPVD